MTVQSILKFKGTGVITVLSNQPLSVAIQVLAKNAIGAVPVLEPGSGKLVGIVSERDIVILQAEHGRDLNLLDIKEVMTTEVVTCSRHETAVDAMRKMSNGRFRHLPVVERGDLVGIVSIGDAVRHRLNELERDAAATREYILTA